MSDQGDVGPEPTCFVISPGLKAPAGPKTAVSDVPKDAASAVLQLKQFAERPILDYGSVELGAHKTLYLTVRNDSLLVQHVALDKLPASHGFSLSADPDLPPAASLSWNAHVPPQVTQQLPVTWQPQEAGPLTELLSFKLEGKHRLQVKLVGTATRRVKQQDAVRAKKAVDQRATAAAGAPGSRPPSSAAGSFSRPASRASSIASTSTAGGGRPATAAAAPSRALTGSRTGVGSSSSSAAAAGRPATAGKAGKAPGSTTTTFSSAAAAQPTFKVPAPRAAQAPPSKLRLKPRSAAGAPARPATAAVGGPGASAGGGADSSKAAVAAWLGSPGGSSSWPAAAAAAAAAGGSGVDRAQSMRSSIKYSPSTLGSRSKTGSRTRKTFSFFHTELWMAKQDKAFTSWLNHLLLPYTPDFLRMTLEDEQSAALTDLRLAAQVQGVMVACYRSDPDLRDVMIKVEKRIDDGRMQLKKEALQGGDIQLYKGALEALLSYNPFWLRLGMEVITQRAVLSSGRPGGAPRDRVGLMEVLRHFAEAHFLGDQELKEEMAAGRGAAHYDMDQYWKDVGDLVLKRFLLLALLLDKVAGRLSSRAHVPLLFRIDGSIKSSSQAVMAFLHGRMVGEGNVLRHLDMLGYKLGYTQSPLIEYPWGVNNLAVDLRDGLRLARLVQELAGDSDIMAKVRFPSDKRPVQLHNSGLSLSALAAAGVPVNALPTSRGLASLTPEDLVDGDRERSLALLWAVARALQLPKLVPLSTLKAELARVLAKGRRLRRQQPQQQLAGPAAAAAAAPLAVYIQDDLVSLLLQWVQAVAAQQGVTVQNFTSCFGDGRVLCLLVAYYLPNALELSEIYAPDITGPAAPAAAGGAENHASGLLSAETSFSSLPGRPASTVERPPSALSYSTVPTVGGFSSPGGYGEDVVVRPGGWCAMFDATGCVDGGAAEVHLKGVTKNFAMVHRAARSLGGVPEMLSSGDFLEHGLDERAVILYVSFLCSRLLEVSREERAAHIIQDAWRHHKANSIGAARAHLHRWVGAVSVIQRAVKAWLFKRQVEQLFQKRRRLAAAVVVLQARWRGQQQRARYLRSRRAAITIQRAWRHYQLHGTKRQAAAALAIQSAWRGHQARQQYGWMARFLLRCLAKYHTLVEQRQQARLLRAVVTCQAGYRGSRQRQQYLQLRGAAVKLQGLMRMRAAQQQLQAARSAAVVIQAGWRRHAAHSRYQQLQQAATLLQAAWRGRAVREQQAQLAAAATVFQATWRGRAVRQVMQESAAFATFLQACYRCQRQRSAFLRLRRAAVVLQAAWRGRQARSRLATEQAAAVAVQAAWRGYRTRQQQAARAAGATAIQAAWRGHAARRALEQQKAAATVLQAAWRGRCCRLAFQQQQAAAVCLQAAWRGRAVRQQCARCAAAALAIQAAWRMHQQQQAYQQVRRSVLLLQARVRGYLATRRFQQQVSAVTLLQAAIRGHQVRLALAQQAAAATSIQSAWRCSWQQQAYQQLRAAAVVVQAGWRGRCVRQQLHRQSTAALLLQSAWRCHAARLELLRHQAAVVIQSTWKMAMARRQLQQQQAAVVVLQAATRGILTRRQYRQQYRQVVALQAAARGQAVRRQLQRQAAAARTLQAAWRGRCVRRAAAAQLAAAVKLQAAWRMRQAVAAYQCQRAAAVAVQAAVRMQQQRSRYQQLRQAAVTLQAAERGRQARHQLQRERAARTIQTAWRRRAALQEAARRRAAVLVIQKNARMLIAKRQVQVMRTYEASCRELRSMLLMLHTRMRAATLIQATWRGHKQRLLFRPTWQAHQEAKQRLAAAITLQRAWRAHQLRSKLQQHQAACDVLARYVPTIRARLAFWRTRQAALVLQRAWRAQQQRREAAALVIQRYVRMAAARRRVQRIIQGVTRIQAAWRGHKVRAAAGRAGRDARRRLAAASAAAAAQPQKRIGVRAREALSVLLASKQCSQVIAAVAAIAHSTRYSKACCSLMVDSGGIEALLAFMRSCNRSKPHMEMLAHALDILANICRWRDLLPAVVMAPDVVAVLTERLQMFRDVEEIFLAGVAILLKLVTEEAHALVVARAAGGTFVKQWEGIGALIGRKMDMERKYIARLEGQKGSDVTAREATRKMVSAAKQLEALHQVVTCVVTVAEAHLVPLVRLRHPSTTAAWASVEAGDAHVPGAAEVAQTAGWQPKNTIVRGVFKEIATNQPWGVVAPAAAGGAPAAGSGGMAAAGAGAAGGGGDQVGCKGAAGAMPATPGVLMEAPGTAQKLAASAAAAAAGGRGGAGGAHAAHHLMVSQQEPSAAMVERLQDMLACLPAEEQQQVLPYLSPSKLPPPPSY